MLFKVDERKGAGRWRWLAVAVVGLLVGCGTAVESHKALSTTSVSSHQQPYTGQKHRLVVGKFENRSPYMRGIFSDGTDRLGLQAQQILKTHLSQSGRFVLMDRVNLEEMATESKLAGRPLAPTAGEMLITGAVTEFGRRETGGEALGGLLGKSKEQVAYAKVQLSVVDVRSSQVLTSAQGAGEYVLSNEEVMGFGSKAGYDATLNDKVLNLAVIEAVNALVSSLEQGKWRPVE